MNSRSCWWTGGLACCASQGTRDSNTTEQLNWTVLNWYKLYYVSSNKNCISSCISINRSFKKYEIIILSDMELWGSTSCEELTHWQRLWWWEGLGAGGEGDDRGWDGWMASLTRWTWVWVNSGSWWWTGRAGMLRFMVLQSRTWLSDWTELNWTELIRNCLFLFLLRCSLNNNSSHNQWHLD